MLSPPPPIFFCGFPLSWYLSYISIQNKPYRSINSAHNIAASVSFKLLSLRLF